MDKVGLSCVILLFVFYLSCLFCSSILPLLLFCMLNIFECTILIPLSFLFTIFFVCSLVIASGIAINILTYNNLVHVNSILISMLYKTLLLYSSIYLFLCGVVQISFYAYVHVMLEQIQTHQHEFSGSSTLSLILISSFPLKQFHPHIKSLSTSFICIDTFRSLISEEKTYLH